MELILLNPFFVEGFIPKTVFDGYWAAQGIFPGDRRYDAFVTVYMLEFGTFMLTEETEIEVYYLDVPAWLEIQEFYLSEAGGCSSPCYFRNPGFLP